MKFNAKLLVVAFILAIFSVGAVAASENVTLDSSELTQVPHEQVVSVSEPTVPEVETTNQETSANDINNEISVSSDNNCTDSYQKGSLRQVKKQESLLGATNGEDILEAKTITPAGTKFYNIRDAIVNADEGDIIDLGGLTYTGSLASNLATSKKITIQNGIIDGIDVTSASQINFNNVIIKDVHFTNFNFKLGKWSRVFFFVDSTLENVKFTNSSQDTYMGMFSGLTNTKAINVVYDGIVSGTCVADIRSSNLTNVNFTNSRVTDDTKATDTGQFTVIINSILDNCNFINTSSKQHSGAICMARGENTVINSNFINCTAWVGGAIYAHGDFVEGNKKYTIENCTFINCHAEEEGGALGLSHNNMDVKNCVFINNTATKGAGIMVGGINHPDGIDGDNSHGHNITMENCYFERNIASEEGGAVHISGDNNTFINSRFYFNEAPEGGAVHITGDNAVAKDSIFDDNFAHGGKGAAIYVKGNYSDIDNSKFTNHDSKMGTVYIYGNHFTCNNSEFYHNTADHGGAGIYVEGNYSHIYGSRFEDNNASRHGGAIHSIGSHAVINNSVFRDNHAHPSIQDEDYGLGGAVYIDGRDNQVAYSKFKHNTARNGSAIYNRGDDLVLIDDLFENNQAWSYFLFTEAKPPESYWSEDMEVLVNVTLVAGDNLINAIYNDRDPDEIYFYNVTYTLNPTDLYPTGIKTTNSSELHPVDGVENSHGGAVLYQDAREDDQIILVNVTYKDGLVFEYSGKTNMYGNVLLALKKENLTDGQFYPGVYNVTAAHPNDDIYTAIDNSTTFTVHPHVDVSVTKTSNKDVYVVGENAIFTIRVYSVGTNATNVKVRDILPSSLKYVDSSATQGKYNSTSNVWDIGFMPHGASQTLTLTVQTTELGAFNNVVNVTCTEKDWNMSNNVDNKTIKVDLYYTKEANVTNTSAGENFEYYLRVYNTGSSMYNETLRVIDTLPEGVQYLGVYDLQGADLVRYINYGFQQIWEITNISAGTRAKITIKVKALKDGVWNNTMQVWNYPPVNATVNVSSNADLCVVKEVSVKNTKKGDLIDWTIFVKNEGPSIAMGAYLDDILPAGLEIYGMTIASKGSYNRNTGRWTIGDMAVGEIQTLTITTRVTVSGTSITNNATVNSTTPDPVPENNFDNETVNVTPEGDVGIEKSVSSQSASHNSIVTWTLNVTNHGPDMATGVYVIDKLPNGLIYINSTRTKGTAYNPVSGRWTIGDLANGESAILTINTRVNIYDGFISNNATVYSTSIDTNMDNNHDENFTQISTVADVSIIKLVSNQTAHYGDEIEWTVIVTNNGPNTAENVYVIDFLPSDLVQTKQPYISKGQIAHLGQNGLWTIGDLANGETAKIIIYTKVNKTDKTIINVVNVTTSTYDSNLSNNWAENGTYVPPEADVEVIKTVNNITPKKDDTIVWTITVINHGPNVAENVVVTDILPEGVQYVLDQGVYHNATGKWNVGRLAPGEKQTLNITTKVVDTGKITNEVNVTTTTYETDLTNNYDNETIDVPAIADLVITKEVSNKTPKYGDLINWTITVTNNGPNNARNVVVNDKLPKGLIYVTHNATTGLYDSVQGIWQIGDVLHFASENIVITTRVNVTNTTITNVAVVTSTTPDSNETNNKANNTTTVGPLADLAIEKIVSDHDPKNGTNIIWTITVTNKGPDAAINAVATDVIPNGLIFVKAEGDGTYDSRTNLWTIGDIENGGTRVLNITTTVNITKAVITNIVNVTSDTPDPDDSNNEDNETIDVGHETDLEIIKTVSNSTPKSGDEIIWNITVINHGPDDAVETVVTDKLPAGLVWISDDSNGAYNHVTGVWNIGTLAKNTNVTLLIKTLVNASGVNITNIANVTTDTHDTNESNNEDNDTVDVPADPKADLEIVKIVSNKNPRFGEEITWTIKVINNGPDTAYNVTVTDKLPSGLIYKTDDSNGKYNPTSGVWDIGELANSEPRVLVITTIVNITNSTITNVAVVNSTTPDPNEENNKATNNTTVAPEADLEIIKLVSNSTVKKGDTITWTITVTNNGPDTALNVFVKDELPTGLVLTGYSVTDGLFDSNSKTWFIQSLAKGKSQNLTLKTLVNVTNRTLINTVNVTNDVYDPNMTNNEANNNTTVAPEADLEVIKTAMNSTVMKGDYLVWNITIINHGPDTVTRIIVTDHAQNGLVFVAQNGTLSPGQVISESFNVTLEVGQSTSIYIVTLVNASNVNLTNEVTVTGNLYDPNPENNYDNDTVEVLPVADLVVVKTVSSNVTRTGEEITWNVTVTNKGPDTAVNTRVTDKLPNGLIYNGHKADVGNYDPESGVWIVGDLASGASKTLIIKSIVNITNKTIVNVANVTSDTPGNKTNGTDNTTSIPEADLEVIKTAMNSTVMKGDYLFWNITIINHGPDTVTEIRVSDHAQNGLVFVNHGGSFANVQTLRIVLTAPLEVGQSRSIYILTLVNASNVNLTNEVIVTGNLYDPIRENNYDNDTVEVLPVADLVVVKTVSSNVSKLGDEITWNVTVTNKGPDTAVNTRVTDKLPNGLIYNGHKADVGNYDPESGVWIVGDLASGASKTLIIKSIVNITNKTIVNVANVTSDTPGNKTNDTDNTTSGPKADLVVVKEVSNKNPKFGEEITWTITVTNKGPDVAVNTKVTDKLPSGLIFVKSNGDYNNGTGIWNVGDLTNGQSKSLVITTIVNITDAIIENIANASSDTPGNNTPGNNTTDVGSIADLEVVKLVSNTTVKPGDIVTWTIIVTNNGPDVAKNVNVTDKLPAGVTYKIHKADYGLYDPSSGVWSIGDMAKGQSHTLAINTTVDIVNGTIENIAVVNSSTPDNNTDNNKANNTTTVDENADLVIVKEVSNKNPKSGDIVTWTIIVTNNGPDVAKNVNVTDKLPSGLTYKAHKADKGLYDPSSGVWIIGDMAKGQTYTLVINTTVDIVNGTVVNVAVVNSSTPDNNTDNNKANNTTTVDENADLVVVKEVSNKNPHKGDIITWTITVTNNGPSDAKNVKVTDKLPDGLVFKGSNGAYNPETGIWTVGDLANGKSASLVITTLVNITNRTITNVANVTSDTPGNRTPGNNTTDVDPEADLVIVKTVSNSTPNKGDIINWTISVTNNGPDAAVNVKIVDNLPDGLLVIVDGMVKPTNEIIVEIPVLEAGKSTEFVIKTLVNVTNATLRNVAVVNSTTYDPNETNNKDNETAEVPAEADLEIIKLVSNATAHKGDIVKWTVIVKNNGPDVAENVYVNDILPNGLVYKAHKASAGLFDSNKMVWFITKLANGESQTLTIDTLVNATNIKLTNIVNVTSDTPDSNKTNNVANNTTDVPPEADIGVVKEVNATECAKDQIVEWKITMTNHGPDAATNVIVKDNLPNTLIFISADGNYNPQTGIWTIDSLASGETRVLTIITKINTTGMVIVNNVTATSGVYDPDMSNNKASNNTTVVNEPVADLVIVKEVSNKNPNKGDIITWTITVTNNGPDSAKNVKVTDKLPSGLTFVSASGDYDKDTGIWTIGDLENGKSVSLIINTRVDVANANLTNVAVVNSTTPDNNTDNNKDNDTTEIGPETADVKVIKTVSNPKPTQGDVITWTIVVANLGPDTAKNVYVEEIMPKGLQLISARGSKGVFLNEIWTVGDLNNGEIATLTLTTKVLASGGKVVNNVIAHTSTYDPNLTNNKDKSTITPIKAKTSADLEIIKVANKEVVKVGDKIIWTITVINHGPDKAINVRVSDWATGDMEFVSASVSKGSFDDDAGIWEVGDMEVGETAVLQITCIALSEGLNINNAAVESDTPDPNEDNNYDSASVEAVKPVPDEHPPKTPAKPSVPTMHATGNPIVMVLLALLAIAGVTLRRKN